MEELLNKLIEKGWYPFCDNRVYQIKIYSDMDIECVYGKRKSDFYYTSYRKLTSKESGLWQFVCKNRMIENGKTVHDYVISHITYSYDKGCGGYAPNNSEFWIMMSALCDEEDLEQFLLDNIKIEGKTD